jgi:hypothetical protein
MTVSNGNITSAGPNEVKGESGRKDDRRHCENFGGQEEKGTISNVDRGLKVGS